MNDLNTYSSVQLLNSFSGLWVIILASTTLLAIALFTVQYLVYAADGQTKRNDYKNKILTTCVTLVLLCSLLLGGGGNLISNALTNGIKTSFDSSAGNSLNVSGLQYELKARTIEKYSEQESQSAVNENPGIASSNGLGYDITDDHPKSTEEVGKEIAEDVHKWSSYYDQARDEAAQAWIDALGIQERREKLQNLIDERCDSTLRNNPK